MPFFFLDEPFVMQLNVSTIHSDSKITSIQFKFRKHHEGKMIIQQGTAFREHIRNVIQGKLALHGPNNNNNNGTNISEDVTFDIPTRLVSPSFASRNTRVRYDLQFIVTFEHGHVFKSEVTTNFVIPLIIANLPHDQLLRISDITSIKSYQFSRECPLFFSPELDAPPQNQELITNELLGSLTAALNSPALSINNNQHQQTNGQSHHNEEPPSYFSLPSLPPQLELFKERKEKTVFLSTSAKAAYNAPELDNAVIIKGLYDEGW